MYTFRICPQYRYDASCNAHAAKMFSAPSLEIALAMARMEWPFVLGWRVL